MDLRSDVLAAAHRLGSRWEVAQEIQRLPAHLREGEVVKGMAAGVYGIGTGLLVLTDRRVLVIREGRASQASEGFPFQQLTGVEWTPTSPTHGNITISDATRATGFTQVIAGEASEFMKLLQIVSGAGPAENRQLAAQTSADAQMMWISVSTVFDRVGAGGDGTVVGLSESEAQPPRVPTDSPGPSGGVSIDDLVAGSHAAASQPVDTSLGAGGQPPSAVAASSGQGATPPPPPDGATRRSRFRLGLTRKLSA